MAYADIAASDADSMVDLSQSKLMSELFMLTSSAITRDEMVRQFTRAVEEAYSIEKVSLREVSPDDASPISRQVLGTRKPYIDNNLGEFSLFPELIGYGDSGYRSYAAIPVMAEGKVISILEMLSHSENKFTAEITSGVTSAALLVGFALAYKLERGRSNRLAEYFDAVFNSQKPQMLVSSDGALVKANKSAVKEFGLLQHNETTEIILGKDHQKLLSDRAGKGAFMLPVRRGDYQKTYSTIIERAGESLFYISMEDVSESALIKSAFDAVSASADTFIIFTDKLMTISDASDNCERVLGYSAGMLSGKNLSELVLEKVKKDFEGSLKQAGKQMQTDLVSLSGYPIRVHFSFAETESGMAFAFSRADAERSVEGLRSQIDDFLSGAYELVIKTDENGYIKYTNLSAESFLGYGHDELSGKDIRFLYRDQSVIERDMSYARSLGKPDNSYVDLIKKDGAVVPGTQSTRLLSDSEGNAEFVIVVKELQTKRLMEMQERELARNAKEMKKMKNTSDLKSQFIYNISHELKTPLTNINGFSKLLYSGDFGELNEEQKQYIKTISDEADRLMLIIQQVLDAAKLEASKVKLELKEVDMSMLGDNPSIAGLREAAMEKGLELDWKVDYNVPKITADPNRLIQVFVNLIGNSIKFTEKGSIKVHIFRKTNKKIQCDVIDTGVGISEEDKKRLFKQFYQVQKKELVKQDGAGTGLGLSITKELVKLHGGDIFLESAFGKGSTFSIVLPITPRRKKRA